MLGVTLEDFAHSFGTSVEDFSKNCINIVTKYDLRYKILKGQEKDEVILNVIKKIEGDRQIIGAPKRKAEWERGWRENLEEFANSGYCDLGRLTPKFIRPNKVIRYNHAYIAPVDPNFELNYFYVFRQWLFDKYFGDFKHIYDFGCGTGFNLVPLAQQYPDKILYGLDFVSSAIGLINKLAEVYHWNMSGSMFDMSSPPGDFQMEESSLAFTSGSVEQLADRFEPFLQLLLKSSPRLCIHIEPTIELYDKNDLLDYLAIKFHEKRGYTRSYLTRLRELENQGRIDILKIKRLCFGNLYMEGYSLIIWRPKRGGL